MKRSVKSGRTVLVHGAARLSRAKLQADAIRHCLELPCPPGMEFEEWRAYRDTVLLKWTIGVLAQAQRFGCGGILKLSNGEFSA